MSKCHWIKTNKFENYEKNHINNKFCIKERAKIMKWSEIWSFPYILISFLTDNNRCKIRGLQVGKCCNKFTLIWINDITHYSSLYKYEYIWFF
jgi:hypothetical protein